MNALVVYDSQYGNTERIATAIADTLRTAGDVRLMRVDATHPLDLEGIDLLILGCPTQGWRPTVPMQRLLANFLPAELRGRAVACFDTRFQRPHWLTGSAAQRMASTLRNMRVSPLVPPESFFVDHTEGPLTSGELGRAAIWARLLLDKVEKPHPVMQR